MTPFDIHTVQPRTWEMISRSYQRGRLSGTYLLHGDEGRGHWFTAISIAALANCDEPVPAASDESVLVPCRKCISCHKVYGINHEGLYIAVPIPPHENDAGKATDFTNEIIEIKRSEPFATIRSTKTALIPKAITLQIKNRLSRKGSSSMVRVVLFYQMEKILPIAADALLKLIEEPPANTLILLTSRRTDSLVETIQSRAIKLRLDPIAPETIAQYLVERCELSEERAGILAKISEGSLGRAMEMALAEEGDSGSQRAVGFRLFKSLVSDESPDMVAHLVDMVNGRDVGRAVAMLQLWQSLIRDCVAYSISGDEKVIINIDFSGEIMRLAGRIDPATAGPAMAECIKNSLADLRRNVHIHGALVALALRLKACT